MELIRLTLMEPSAELIGIFIRLTFGGTIVAKVLLRAEQATSSAGNLSGNCCPFPGGNLLVQSLGLAVAGTKRRLAFECHIRHLCRWWLWRLLSLINLFQTLQLSRPPLATFSRTAHHLFHSLSGCSRCLCANHINAINNHEGAIRELCR